MTTRQLDRHALAVLPHFRHGAPSTRPSACSLTEVVSMDLDRAQRAEMEDEVERVADWSAAAIFAGNSMRA